MDVETWNRLTTDLSLVSFMPQIMNIYSKYLIINV